MWRSSRSCVSPSRPTCLLIWSRHHADLRACVSVRLWGDFLLFSRVLDMHDSAGQSGNLMLRQQNSGRGDMARGPEPRDSNAAAQLQVGARIRHARILKGLRMRDLAKEVGCDESMISKIEAGEQEMHYEAVSLNDVLGETVAMMQPQANRERVIIRSSFASNLPEVVADPRSVRQIALNLLSNAVRYTPAGGQVIISTAYSADGSVVMRVRDTGIGMNPAEIEEALKPFKQINSLKRKRGDGTGLGLPLTRAMVEANRAVFAINSVPAEGTLVEVSFPPTRVLAD
ncbi:HAMP domain-containing sensor histidine kinase [uncultured Nitratireductor sp.]|uniref:sensor histidine kinase n=1 Tax=uncultured Nitratireductor sp. TaxID=520953 RepID=UPI0034596FFD